MTAVYHICLHPLGSYHHTVSGYSLLETCSMNAMDIRHRGMGMGTPKVPEPPDTFIPTTYSQLCVQTKDFKRLD